MSEAAAGGRVNEARELEELIGILRELNAVHDPSGRLAAVVMRAARALGAESGSLFLLAGEPPHLEARVANQPAAGPLPESGATPVPVIVIPPDRGTAGWVVTQGRSLRLDDAEADPRFVPYFPGSHSIRNLLSVPLKTGGAIYGTIDVVNRPGGFDDAAEAFLAAVADELAIALKNSNLIRSLEKEKLALEVMREVSHTLLSTLRVDEVLERIVVGLGRLVAFDAVGIFLVGEDGTLEHVIERGYDEDKLDRVRQKVGEGVVGWSITTGKAVIVPDVRVDNRYFDARLESRSEMVAPLVTRGRVIGAFNLESNEIAAYDAEDLARLRAFADSASMAIEVARLHEEAVRARRLDEDLAIAREIQLTFLPDSAPELRGYDLAGLNVPSLEVGGDYYDFVDVSPGQLGLAIGDVAGKGIPAGLIMASFRASLLAEIRNNYAISTVLGKVNRLLVESTEPNRFVTALYGVLDLDKRRFTYASAGHYPAILLHEDGTVRELNEGGTVLGAFPDMRYPEDHIHLREGDMLILYTDGVTEAMSESMEEFGTERLIDMAMTVRSRPAKKIAAAIKRAVLSFSKQAVPGDDLTLVILKVGG